MSESKFATFEDLLELAGDELRPIASRLKEIILELDPEACEVVRLGDKAATYGLGPKKMSEGYAYILPYKNWVNLGFYKGALLNDKTGVLEGTGKNMRHYKVRSIEDANRVEVKELLKLALKERKTALNR